MRVSREFLIEKLPPDMDTWVTVADDQDVKDIIRGMCDWYAFQAPYYDDIGLYFQGDTIGDTCDKLYDFCKANIQYIEEGEDWQSIPLPNGILTKGHGDCKTYASFIGGCLGAIARATGQPIDWAYCFASYKLFRKTPYHVFVVVNTDDGQIWVDPTPGADSKAPVWYTTKRPYEHMALMAQIAGMSVGGDGSLSYSRVGTTPDPTGQQAAASVESFINSLPDGELKTALQKSLTGAFTQIVKWISGYKYTGGDYALGEIFLDRVMDKQTSSRWDTPDAIIPIAWNYFTQLFGIPIAVNTDLDTIIQSGNLDDYLEGRPEHRGYVTQAQVERAHTLINMLQPHDKYGQWPPSAFGLLPYAGPIPDARTPGALYSGQLPNGQQILNGYPVSGATSGGNITIPGTTTTTTTGMSQKAKTALLIAAGILAIWWISENE